MMRFKTISNLSDVDVSDLPCEECLHIFSELLDMPGLEIAYCVCEGALVVRMYDGDEYVFDYPYLFDGADAECVLRAISVYTRREMIPFVLTNVPREELGCITDLFPLVTAEAFDEDLDLFVVRVENEISTLSEIPEAAFDAVTLKEISKCDIEAYYELCTDDDINKYWGYDYKIDNPNPALDYFYNVAMGEFNAGVALALGVYVEDKFVGECVMYDFDYFGNCEIGVRLLKAEHSKGYAGMALRAIFELGCALGLKCVCTRVKAVNAPAVKFVGKYMDFVSEENGDRLYSFTIE